MSDADKTFVFKPGALPGLADAGVKPGKARLVCLDHTHIGPSQKELVIELEGNDERTLGRDREAGIFIESMQVSRKHAALYAAENGWGVRDLKSTNGVFINGKQVSDAQLSPGDIVKFGAIPFRFEVEGAAPAEAAGLARFKAMGEGDVEKTMMFGDVRASSKLLAAQDSDGEAAPPPEAKKAASSAATPVAKPVAKPVVKPTARPVAKPIGRADQDPDKTQKLDMAAATAPPKKGGLAKNIFFGLVAVLVIGAGYFGFTMLRESNIVETKRDAVSRFVREAATFDDPKRFGDERKALAKLKEELTVAIVEAPDKPELRPLLERVMALEFERDFYEAMAASNFAQARSAITGLRRKLAAVDGKSGTPSEAENLAATMEPVIALREFAKAFPDHQQKSPAPGRAQLEQLLAMKEQFTKMQRIVNMDLVRHPFLGRLLDQANQDLRLLERWDVALRTSK